MPAGSALNLSGETFQLTDANNTAVTFTFWLNGITGAPANAIFFNATDTAATMAQDVANAINAAKFQIGATVQAGTANVSLSGLVHFANNTSPVVFVPTVISGEPDGQPSLNANSEPDDNGVTIGAIRAGFSLVPVTVNAIIDSTDPNLPHDANGNAFGYLLGWVDWTAAGTWTASDQVVFQDANGNIVNTVYNGTTTLYMRVPSNVTPGTTYARIRLSSTPNVSYDGQYDAAPNTAYGEVEDYQVQILPMAQSWGDAPDHSIGSQYSYPVTSAEGGAHAMISYNPVPGQANFDQPDFYMAAPGTVITPKPDGTPTLNPDSDPDNNGITFGAIHAGFGLVQVTVTAEIDSTDPNLPHDANGNAFGYLLGWADWSESGNWSAGDALKFQDANGNPVTTVYNGTTVLYMVVPNNAVVGSTYLRVRLSSSPNVSFDGSQDGTAPNTPYGQVDDFVVQVLAQPQSWGDAPDQSIGPQYTYPVTRAEGGAHVMISYNPTLGAANFDTPDFYLGADASTAPAGNTANLSGEQFQLTDNNNTTVTFTFWNSANPGPAPANAVLFNLADSAATMAQNIANAINTAAAAAPAGSNLQIGATVQAGTANVTLSGLSKFTNVTSPVIYVPAVITGMTDGQPSLNPNSNPNNGGIVVGNILRGMNTGWATVTSNIDPTDPNVAGKGYLVGWVDWNDSGVWTAGDQVQFLVNGTVQNYVVLPNGFDQQTAVSFVVPSTASLGKTYVRFRLTNTLNVSYNGTQDGVPGEYGEVADYAVQVNNMLENWGTAPEYYASTPSQQFYPTTAAHDGALQFIHLTTAGTPDFHLGATVDASADGQPALGPIGNGSDDGVQFPTYKGLPSDSLQVGGPNLLLISATPSAAFVTSSAPSGYGYLNAWIDYYGNGWSAAGDQVVTDLLLDPRTSRLGFQQVAANPARESVHDRQSGDHQRHDHRGDQRLGARGPYREEHLRPLPLYQYRWPAQPPTSAARRSTSAVRPRPRRIRRCLSARWRTTSCIAIRCSR